MRIYVRTASLAATNRDNTQLNTCTNALPRNAVIWVAVSVLEDDIIFYW